MAKCDKIKRLERKVIMTIKRLGYKNIGTRKMFLNSDDLIVFLKLNKNQSKHFEEIKTKIRNQVYSNCKVPKNFKMLIVYDLI